METNKYEYPNFESEYKDNKSYITIICKECGNIFKQRYNHHFKRGQGCPICNNKVKSLETLIKTLKEIHHNKYEYPNLESEYKNSKSRITIKCKKCGHIFEMSLNHHLYGLQGCKKCKKLYSYKTHELINKFNKIHNNEYEYPNLESEY